MSAKWERTKTGLTTAAKIEPIALLYSINITRNIALAPRTKLENNRQIRLMCFLSLLPPIPTT